MELTNQPETEFLPPTPIRVESGLSRYPVHRLAKHGDISIDIREKNVTGETFIKWEVNYIGKFGQPGPLAYKLDTLVINRRIEESARPIPRVIKLGSLKEIAGKLELGGDTNLVKKALRQNAGTFIIAKIDYKRADGTIKKLEADFNRYSVVFSGEELPDGRKADAVYIVLNDIYMQVINGAITRPLDYDYLKSLPPAPQRFYELLSYQMYAAIKNDRHRAKLLYSELCTYAPLTRHLDWEHARSQLAKIHRPHKASGYIAKFDTQDTTDANGQPDWILLYQPGPKARAEYRAFTKRGGPVTLEVEPFVDAAPSFAASQELALPLTAPEPSPQESALIGHGVTPATAGELVREYGEDKAKHQIEHLEWMMEKKPGKIADPAGWLCNAIRTDIALPKSFVSKAERERRAEEKKAAERQVAEARQRQREHDAAEKAERQAINAYRKELTPAQLADHEAYAVAQADDATRQTLEQIGEVKIRRLLLGSITDEYIRRLLREAVEPA